MYEMGASRVKHTLAAGTKNILALAYMIPIFWMFGWWIYLAMTNGFVPDFEAGAGSGMTIFLFWLTVVLCIVPLYYTLKTEKRHEDNHK